MEEMTTRIDKWNRGLLFHPGEDGFGKGLGFLAPCLHLAPLADVLIVRIVEIVIRDGLHLVGGIAAPDNG